MLPSNVRTFLNSLVAFLLLVAFVAVFGVSILYSWLGRETNLTRDEGNFVYIATALAGLVGGIVAVAFGAPPPDAASDSTDDATTGSPQGGVGASVARAVTDSANALTAVGVMSSLYSIVYFGLGALAIAVATLKADQASDLVKNFASVAFGILLVVARGFFATPTLMTADPAPPAATVPPVPASDSAVSR
jgi:hypothetical protein